MTSAGGVLEWRHEAPGSGIRHDHRRRGCSLPGKRGLHLPRTRRRCLSRTDSLPEDAERPSPRPLREGAQQFFLEIFAGCLPAGVASKSERIRRHVGGAGRYQSYSLIPCGSNSRPPSLLQGRGRGGLGLSCPARIVGDPRFRHGHRLATLLFAGSRKRLLVASLDHWVAWAHEPSNR